MYRDVHLLTSRQTAAFILAIESHLARDPHFIFKNVQALKFSLDATVARLRCEQILEHCAGIHTLSYAGFLSLECTSSYGALRRLSLQEPGSREVFEKVMIPNLPITLSHMRLNYTSRSHLRVYNWGALLIRCPSLAHIMLDITALKSNPRYISLLIPSISALLSLVPSSSLRHVHCALTLMSDQSRNASLGLASAKDMLEQFSGKPSVSFIVFQPRGYGHALVSKCSGLVVVPYRERTTWVEGSVWRRSVADGRLWEVMDLAAQARASGQTIYM